jgi:Tfp pilus assembly protein PilF
MKITKLYITIALTFILQIIYGCHSFSYAQNVDSLIIKDTSYYFLKGVENYNNKKFELAKENLNKVLSMNPNNDAAYFYLAKVAIEDNDYVAGEAYIKEAISKDSSNFWYKDFLGKLYAFTKRADDAILVYENLLKEFPSKTDIYYNLINLYLNNNNLEKADSTLDKIERIFGKSEAIGMTKFNIFRIKNDWNGALNYLINFDNGFNSAAIETIIGDLYSDRFKDTLAIKYYQKALDNEPNFPLALYGLSEIYRTQNNSEMFFKNSYPLFSNPDINSKIKSDYVKQIMQNQRFVLSNKPQMDSLIDAFTASSPLDTLANYTGAIYYAQTGNPDKCIKLLKKNFDLYPDNKETSLNYLSYIYSTEDWKLLAEESDKMIKLFPNEVYPTQLYAISMFQLKNFEESAKALEKQRDLAIKTNDTSALLLAYSLLGDTYHELKQPSKTFNYYKKALSIDPLYLPVLNNYAYYLSLEKKSLKKAYKMSAITVEKEPDNPTYLDTFGWILYLMNKPIEAKAHFKHAMLYGGKEHAAILDHYAEVLYKLKEYDLAFIYWDQANEKDPSLNIMEKVKLRKKEIDSK